jgi:hypothetical protein
MSLVQPSIAFLGVGNLRRLFRIAPRDGESSPWLNESQAFLANDFRSVSPVLSVSCPSAQWICQRELDVTIGLALSLITWRNELHLKSYWTRRQE